MSDLRPTRRGLLHGSAALAALAAASGTFASAAAVDASSTALVALPPPASGLIPVAFPISGRAVPIDFPRPWEVFGNASMVDRNGAMDMSGRHGFQLYTVAETSSAITA